MNIFASYPCPKKSAQVLDDRRLIKMILETAQMFTTNMILLKSGVEEYDCTNLRWKIVRDRGKVKSAQLVGKKDAKVFYFAGTRTQTYRPTHPNHPCTVWARETCDNAEWLLRHFWELMDEYSRRFGRKHYCDRFSDYFIDFVYTHGELPKGSMTEFADCTNIEEGYNVHEKYRRCLFDKWMNDKYKPRWGRVYGSGPDWAFDFGLLLEDKKARKVG